MKTLSRDLRKDLERAVISARRAATKGARKALMVLAVQDARPYGALSEAQKKLRNRLRAHGRLLGDQLDGKRETQEVEHLVAECAYEQWHRMLFARFLAENDLLIHPEYDAPVSLDECRALARSRGVGWVELAAEYAERMLPQIFRRGDPVLEVVLPPEARHELEELLESLPRAVFTADDSVGWTYQFWQTERKDEVNASRVKIGADELAPVTQLFTEDYMVLFLLHNTLGAWWAAKCCPDGVVAASEEEARTVCSLPGVEWGYLRFVQDEDAGRWRPAAGAFEGWPRAAKDVTMLDPCMGSGHFLVFALPVLAAFRVAEEGLSHEDAIQAVLRDNLYGLELDARCTQIAAFNLALAAWRMVGHRALPSLNLACSGLGINAMESEWTSLAKGDERLANTMGELFRLFKDAPTLGSLIDPARIGGSLFLAHVEDVQPLVERALNAESVDELSAELAVTARGVVQAARILSGKFTAVVTNVPYLGRGKQDGPLSNYCERFHPRGKADLSTSFLERCLSFASDRGTAALVTPQNWLFLGTYTALRESLLQSRSWNGIVKLGPSAFHDMNWWAATTALVVLTNEHPSDKHRIVGLDVSSPRLPEEKAALIRSVPPTLVGQAAQLHNPDARLLLKEAKRLPLLRLYAESYQGVSPADSYRFSRYFWEIAPGPDWRFWQSTVAATLPYGGRELVLWWNDGLLKAVEEGSAYLRGERAWGQTGIVVSQMRHLPCTLYSGEPFDTNCAVIVPKDQAHLAAIWCYCSSVEFAAEVREIDQKTNVTNATLVKVPFDLERWQRVAFETCREGPPRPWSDDPTQWLFDGDPSRSRQPLQVAVARLVGFRWPRQTGSQFLDCNPIEPDRLDEHADDDGIVCMSPLHQEGSAADRLRGVLADAFGREWSAVKHEELLAQVGFAGSSLEEWLREGFFKQHCELFHEHPFVWHIWDGRRDGGFGALVNYHRLVAPNGQGQKLLEKLTHTYLGDWIARQRADQKAGVAGADARLAAAQHLQRELEKILNGEPPYDLFARWRPLHQQPIGWEPDLDDGVRINIRPFVTARTLYARGKSSCILRVTPRVPRLDKADRGNDGERPKADFPWLWAWDRKAEDFEGGREFDGNRWNDLHYTGAFKQAARERHQKRASQ